MGSPYGLPTGAPNLHGAKEPPNVPNDGGKITTAETIPGSGQTGSSRGLFGGKADFAGPNNTARTPGRQKRGGDQS